MDIPPLRISYNAAESPTLQRFHQSNAIFRGVMGPFGSGKSTACCLEIWKRACQQAAYQGVRRSRWLLIRNTYAQLKSTTIQTWQQWFPSEICPIVYDAPIRGRLQFRRPDDDTLVDLDVWFLSLDSAADVDKITSLEITGFYLNEARRIPRVIVNGLMGRIGRFPPDKEGGPTWTGGIADTNPPDEQHWWHETAEIEKPTGWEFFRQPPALLPKQRDGKTVYLPNPDAENIAHISGGYRYYFNQLSGASLDHIRIHILGEYGHSFEGRPVYEGLWSESLHVAKDNLSALPGLPLRLGFDYGLTPACCVAQMTTTGQLRLLREYCFENGGMRQFCESLLVPGLQNDFPEHKIPDMLCWDDPAGKQRAQGDSDITARGILESFGFKMQGVLTNDFEPRREAVAWFLSRTVDGQPAFKLDGRCQTLKGGFAGGYLFSRRSLSQSSNEQLYSDRPEKNRFSHIHDALQYLCLGLRPAKSNTRKPDPPRRDTWGAMTA